MRRTILDGAVARGGLEGRIRYDERYLARLVDTGAVVELPEAASLDEALDAIKEVGQGLLILPRSFHPSKWEAERGVKDKTEAYDGFDYPRRVQAAVRARLAAAEADEETVEPWLRERGTRQHTLTKPLVRALRMAPMDFHETMMTDPLPLPETGIGLPRARERAKEPRGNIGYTFSTLDTPHTNILVPWYTLVEGAANAARQFLLFTDAGGRTLDAEGLTSGNVRVARASVSIRRRQGGTFSLTGRHEAFPGSALGGERYQLALGRIAFGPKESETARLQEWVNAPNGRYAFCGCDDSRYRGRENTWHAHPAAKVCKHQASASYWMQAMGRHEFTEHLWHASLFLLPLQEAGGRRYSEALRARRVLKSRMLLRDRYGNAEPVPALTQSLLYGAIHQRLYQERGFGLFMPGIMTGERLAGLARQEAQLLRDKTYQRI